MKPALVIIAQKGYQDIELAGTRKGLEDAGFHVTLASVDKGPCEGKFGGKEMADIALKDVTVADYDRIAFIGGPGAHALAENDDAKRIAYDAVTANMILGAICIAPTILAAAGVLKEKGASVWDDGQGTQISFIESRGAIYSEQEVTIDGRIITANGPEAAEEFGKLFAML